MATSSTVHDLNNSLLAIRGYAELLQQGDLDPKVRERVDGIAREAAQGAMLTRQLLGSTDAPAANGVSSRPSRGERILIVEDKEALRRLVADALSREGYVVTATGSPEEALLRAGELEGFDLVVTDIVIPGMKGNELASRLRELHPAAKTIYMSGHTKQAAVDRHGLESDALFLQKPFLLGELAATVRDVLDASNGSA